ESDLPVALAPDDEVEHLLLGWRDFELAWRPVWLRKDEQVAGAQGHRPSAGASPEQRELAGRTKAQLLRHVCRHAGHRRDTNAELAGDALLALAQRDACSN